MKTLLLLVALFLVSANVAAAGRDPGGNRAHAVRALSGGETGNG